MGPPALRKLAALCALTSALAGTLTACGGGGSDDGAATPSGTGGPYTVGGTLSGLAGHTNLALSNGPDTVIMGANGSFSFPTPVAAQGGYSVSVSRKPVGQTCTVSQGSGTASGDVNNVQVSCEAPAYTVLHRLGESGVQEGLAPAGPMVIGDDGMLYGVNAYGGSASYGTAYKMSTAGVWTLLHTFTAANGNPRGALLAVNGQWLGVTTHGGATDEGSAYLLGANDQLTKVADLSSPVLYPMNGLTQLDATTFVGTSVGSGTTKGAIYTVDIAAGTRTLRHSFSDAEGTTPRTALTLGPDQLLWGTLYSGTQACGAVFRVNGDWSVSLKHAFVNSTSDGCHPVDGLLLASDGTLYGQTEAGGASGNGVAYSIQPSGAYAVLHHFDTATGSLPESRMIEGTDGHLYGVTAQGGTYEGGVLFQLTKDGRYTVLHHFGESLQGRFPMVSLTLAADGHLYGVTNNGGLNVSGFPTAVFFRY